MATSKSGSSAKKSAAKKPTRSSATKVTKTTVVAAADTPAIASTPAKKRLIGANYPAIILAEVIGTFILTLVALLSLQQFASLYVGLTVAVLVLAVGAVSGAHLNPAVTFGLWSVRRIKSILLPVYWVAQFVGAILAVLLLGLFTGSGYGLDFSHFTQLNWGILSVELIGTAVFLFGLVAAVSNEKLSNFTKAFGIGLSLMVGLLVSGSLFSTLQSGVDTSNVNISDASTIPREYSVKGATLNPAIAVAVTENTPSQLSGYSATNQETKYSRIGLEVIIGTLVGAAVGSNLYLLLAYVNRRQG